MELFTIALMVYQQRHRLERCLEYIFQQDYKAVELIVCDDDSCDFDVDEVEAYIYEHKSDQIQFVTVHKQPAYMGQAAGCQTALSMAHGTYMMFLTVEQELYGKDALTKMAQYIRMAHGSVLVSRSLPFWEDGGQVYGHAPGYHALGELKADGTFHWSSSAFNNGTGRARFDGGGFAVEKIHWFEMNNEQDALHFVTGVQATPEEFDAAQEAQDAKPVLDFVKETLGDKIKEARVSKILKTAPVCMTADGPMSLEMEKYFQRMGDDMGGMKAQRVLELNADSPVYGALARAVAQEPEKAKKYAQLLYDQALIIAGLPVEDTAKYTELVCSLMG